MGGVDKSLMWQLTCGEHDHEVDVEIVVEDWVVDQLWVTIETEPSNTTKSTVNQSAVITNSLV